jgi:hypothetical protein
MLLAAMAIVAIPLSGGAQAGSGGVGKGRGHSVFKERYSPSKHYRRAYKHRRHSRRLHRRRPQVAGFRFAAGGHAYGYEYQSYPEFNYGPPSRKFHGYFGYCPNFDNRTFVESTFGGGIRFGGMMP